MRDWLVPLPGMKRISGLAAPAGLTTTRAPVTPDASCPTIDTAPVAAEMLAVCWPDALNAARPELFSSTRAPEASPATTRVDSVKIAASLSALTWSAPMWPAWISPALILSAVTAFAAR